MSIIVDENEGSVVIVDEPHIKIGMQEVYVQLQRVAEGNQRLDAKIDQALSNQTIRMEALVAKNYDLEKDLSVLTERVRILELRPVVTPKAIWAGVGTILTGISIIIAIVALVVK